MTSSREMTHLDISTDARKRLAENNEALLDGSYPIRNKGDLQRAIQSYGRASDKENVKKWIIKRARELDAVDMLPESWDVEEIAHSDELMHHGVKGQKWGVHKPVDRVTSSKSDSKTTTPVQKDSDSTSTKNGGGGGGGGGGSSDDDEDADKDAKDDGLPEGDTRKEFDERQKMIDEFLKSKGKGDAKKAGGGKGGGGGKGKGGKKSGGGKKGGAKKSSGGSSNSSSSTSSSSSVSSVSTPKSSYPARQSISNLLKNVPSTTKTTSPAVQSIIDKINASVEARRKTVLTTTEDEVQHTDESTGRNSAMTHEETVALGADAIDDFLVQKSDELAHYGVLGMKWGVRNDDRGGGRPQGGASRKKAPLSSVKKMVSSKKTKTGAPKTETQETNKSSNAKVSEAKVETQQESAQKSGRSMSDQELRDAINRMQMEKTYSQLMAERNPAPAKKADSVIKKIVSDSAKQAVGQILTNAAKTVGTYAIAAAISKSNPALANAMMKGVGDNAKKAAETKTDSPDAPDATVSTPKTSSQNSSSSKSSDSKSSSSSLDLGPTPQSKVDTKAVEDAYSRAYGESSSSTKQILDDLAKLREK